VTETSFTRLVGCKLPLQQAGMGGAATPQLVAAVAEAGALGMLGLAGAPAPAVIAGLESVASLTKGSFGVNFLMPFVDREGVAAAAGRARLVEFFYGDPDVTLVKLVHDGGSLAAWQIGSADEARAAADVGCDLVVAQGVEAGGHVRGEVGLLSLLELVLDAVSLPVVAAGGLGTARSVAAVIAAGASGARVGTRFLAAEEANVHPAYLESLIAARAEDTVLTTTFGASWPDAPHRVLKTCVDAALKLDEEVIGETKLANGTSIPMQRFSSAPPGRSATGHIEAMAQYAGQSVEYLRGRMPAAQIVAELTAEL
jgi:NAD(P)H-dependent flavin oxidoreductase YrpB (nitropropane dioxygenase family)